MPSKLDKKELNDIIQWDVKTWSKVLPFWESNFDIKPGMKVLAIGEREGGLSMWFAKKGCQVTCTDYNDFPETTKELHLSYGVSENINYEMKVDATDLSRFESESFDIVVFKSVIGVLEQKERLQQALNEMHRVVRKGGGLLFAENLTGSAMHRYLRKKYVDWGDGSWKYLHARNDMDLFDKFDEKNFKAVGFLSNFGQSEKQKSVFGSLDKLMVWALPRKWKYVLFGALVKR